MKNMGLHDLRLVHPPLDRKKEAHKLAHGATDVLESARRVFELDEAINDVNFLVGTTARLGGWRTDVTQPREIAPRLCDIARQNKVAILFGSEDRGLSNETIACCQALLHIPTSREHTSLNLAQAVLLVGYELMISQFPADARSPKLASIKHVEAMFEDLSQVLQMIDFLKPGNPDYWMLALRRLLGRTGLTQSDINLFRGICRQVRWVHSLVPSRNVQPDDSEVA